MSTEYIGVVGGKTVTVSAEFTRPADTTAYTGRDVVSNSATTTLLTEIANFVRIPGGSGYIVGARLSTNLKSITPVIRVHLFNVGTGVTIAADNAAWKEVYADISKRLGYFDMPALSTGFDSVNSDMSRAVYYNLRIPIKAAKATRSIWFALETIDVFTPASGQKFTLTLHGDMD